MPHFRVLLNGENFWFELDGTPSRQGFFTTRFVEAQDEHEAEHNALAMVCEDPKLKDALSDPSNPPVIYCACIAPMEAIRPEDVVQTGFSFYSAETCT